MTTLSPGDTFAGYVIDGVIARGGMGVVYRATQLQPHRQVALKLIAPEHATDPGYRERFLREADLLASLEHCPSIVPIYAAGEFEGQLYLAMRLMDGQDLGRRLETDSPLSLAQTVAILEPVAAALDAAHESGLVHRDVKPANILFDSRGRVYLTDFGLTKRAGSESGLTRPGQAVGTAGYMAPEQFTGRPSDPALAPRIDVYALGCVVHACLTGTEPFPRDSYEQALFAHVYDPPPKVVPGRPDLPPEVDDILARALAKDPVERYATAGDLVAALAAVVPKAGPYPPVTTPEPEVDRTDDAETVVAAGVVAALDLVPPAPSERRRLEVAEAAPIGEAASVARGTEPVGGAVPTAEPTTDRAGQDTVVVTGGGGGLGGGGRVAIGGGGPPTPRSWLVPAVVGSAAILGLAMILVGSGVLFPPKPSASPIAQATRSPSISTGPTAIATTAPTPTPRVTIRPTATPASSGASGGRLGSAADVAAVRALVPASIRSTCESSEVFADAALAAVRCSLGDDLVWYELYPDVESQRASYESTRTYYDVARDTKGCTDGKPGESSWSYDSDSSSTIRGRYVCALSDDGYAWFYATFEDQRVILNTLDSTGDITRLHGLWFGGTLDPVTP